MSPEEFISKWKRITLKESSAAQSHFNDLCELLGVPKPLDVDPKGDFYTFEKAVKKVTGGKGFADAWYKAHFAWEYKGKGKNLQDAYIQLLAYRSDLGNPPLLVVCDLETIEIHTNFTNTNEKVITYKLDDLKQAEKRQGLRRLWENPEGFNPAKERQLVTEATVRDLLADIAEKIKKPWLRRR